MHRYSSVIGNGGGPGNVSGQACQVHDAGLRFMVWSCCECAGSQGLAEEAAGHCWHQGDAGGAGAQH